MFFIYKHSERPFLSVIIFMGIEFFTLSFTALRQMIAVSIVINSYTFIKQKKPIKFVLVVLLASLFHKTALLFLIAYPLKDIKINKKAIIIGLSGLLIMQIVGFSIIVEVFRKFYPYYVPENIKCTTEGMVQAFVMLFYIIQGLYIYNYKIDKKVNEEYNILFIIMFLAFCIQSFTNRVPMLNRLMWYFYTFSVIFLPNLISKIKNDKMRHCFFAEILILYLAQYITTSMTMYNVVPYEFFIK